MNIKFTYLVIVTLTLYIILLHDIFPLGSSIFGIVLSLLLSHVFAQALSSIPTLQPLVYKISASLSFYYRYCYTIKWRQEKANNKQFPRIMAEKLDFAPLPSFNPHSDPNSLAARWKTWIKRFQTFIKAANIMNKTQQRALLLHQAGPEVQDILKTLAYTGRDDDLDTAIISLTEYFAPAQYTDFKIFRFLQGKQ